MSVVDNVKKVKESLKEHPEIKIIGAVKYFDVNKTKEIVEAGIKDIGENRKDAFLEKYEALKSYDVTWHYFGAISVTPRPSSNFLDSIDYFHSLDSINVASAINKYRKKKEPLKCFIKVDVAGGKSGIAEAKVISFIKSLANYEKIKIVGLMTVGKFTFDEDLVASYFDIMKELQKEVQELNLDYAPCTELSMGMSHDYLIASNHGSTMVRLGSILG